MNIKEVRLNVLGKPFMIGENVFVCLANAGEVKYYNIKEAELYSVERGETQYHFMDRMREIYDGEPHVLNQVEYVHHIDNVIISILGIVRGVQSSYIAMQGKDSASAIELIVHVNK